jgi:hypothetical protein
MHCFVLKKRNKPEKITLAPSTFQLASEQAAIEKQIEALQDEVRHQDECVKLLQKQFKEAENVLVSSVRKPLRSVAENHQPDTGTGL